MRLSPARSLERIQAGKLSAGYLLLGKEIYWRDRIIEALRKALGAEQAAMGIAEFDLRGDSLSRVLEAARERSLLSPRQLLIIRNSQSLSSRQRKEGEGEPAPARRGRLGRTSQSPDDLAAYFRDPSPDSVLVLEMMDADLDSDDWRERDKVKARLEAFGNLCDVVLLAAPSLGEAMQLAQQEAAARGLTFTPEAAERLVTEWDRDMSRIRMEIEKLSLFDPGKTRIEAEDLNRWTGSAAGAPGLPLIEAIGSGNARTALEALGEVDRSGRYPPLVLLELTRYLRQLILLKENKVREPRQAANVLWGARLAAPQSFLPSLLEQSRKFSGRSLLKSLQLAYDAEVALRSSPPADRIILENFVLRLMKPIRSVIAEAARGGTRPVKNSSE
jgi:DNA polymerase III delta subunit